MRLPQFSKRWNPLAFLGAPALALSLLKTETSGTVSLVAGIVLMLTGAGTIALWIVKISDFLMGRLSVLDLFIMAFTSAAVLAALVAAYPEAFPNLHS